MTFRELITEASVMAGITALGETLDGNSETYGQNKLNQLIDLWAADRLSIYRRQRAGQFDLVSGTASYTIGSGATWNVARPLWIDGASVIPTPSATYPVELPIDVFTTKQWQQIVSKTSQSALPQGIWYDRTFANGTIYVYPVPDTSVPDIVLYVPIAVTEVTDLTTTVSLPPGYRMALISNLAILMALGLREIPADIRLLATTSLGQLKGVNLVEQMDPLECEEAVLQSGSGQFNWYSGEVQ